MLYVPKIEKPIAWFIKEKPICDVTNDHVTILLHSSNLKNVKNSVNVLIKHTQGFIKTSPS